MDDNKDPTITLKLSELANLLLGSFNDSPIPSVIHHLLPELLLLIDSQKEQLYYIELHPENFHPELFGPRIYRYSTWKDSHESWIKRKERSEQERRERFILEANIKLLAKRLRKLLCMNEQYSIGTAAGIMRMSPSMRDMRLKMLDVVLITRIEEIP